jgi:hypothetical protein
VEGLRFAAMSGAFRSSLVPAPTDGNELRLALAEQPRMKLVVLSEQPIADPIEVACVPQLSELDFASTRATGSASGEVDLPLWPGVPCAVSTREGVSLLAAGPVPEEVDLTAATPSPGARDPQ